MVAHRVTIKFIRYGKASSILPDVLHLGIIFEYGNESIEFYFGPNQNNAVSQIPVEEAIVLREEIVETGEYGVETIKNSLKRKYGDYSVLQSRVCWSWTLDSIERIVNENLSILLPNARGDRVEEIKSFLLNYIRNDQLLSSKLGWFFFDNNIAICGGAGVIVLILLFLQKGRR
jgi:hypothetical protein